MAEFLVVYKGGGKDTVTAKNVVPEEDSYVFFDSAGSRVAVVPKENVKIVKKLSNDG